MKIPPKLQLLLCLGVVAFAAWGMWPQTALRRAPGVLAAGEPQQRLLPPHALGEVRGFALTAHAEYALQARVLHTKRYWDDGAKLVPYDVALGWGPMSDQAVLDGLEIDQGHRFFFYEWRSAPPIPEKEIASHAANHHLIAANASVAKTIRQLRAGQVVRLRGYLVQATRPDGFSWMTSLSRTDTGGVACELYYVETAQFGDGG